MLQSLVAMWQNMKKITGYNYFCCIHKNLQNTAILQPLYPRTIPLLSDIPFESRMKRLGRNASWKCLYLFYQPSKSFSHSDASELFYFQNSSVFREAWGRQLQIYCKNTFYRMTKTNSWTKHTKARSAVNIVLDIIIVK